MDSALALRRFYRSAACWILVGMSLAACGLGVRSFNTRDDILFIAGLKMISIDDVVSIRPYPLEYDATWRRIDGTHWTFAAIFALTAIASRPSPRF